MDVNQIANLATNVADTSTAQAASMAVLKKALEIQGAAAVAMIEQIPEIPSTNLPLHLGQNVNTTA